MTQFPDYKALLKHFPEDREQKLRTIRRYSMFEVYFYRPTLWHHSLRVFFMLNELSVSAKNILQEFDMKKAQLIALVHDDAEMITGDVQLGHKQQMTEAQLKVVEDNEASALEQLSELYPNEMCGYEYKDLLRNALYKDTLEAQLVSYADKLDAYNESLHEVLGGNISALRAVMNYVGVLKDFPRKFPALKQFFDHDKTQFTTTEFFLDPWRVNTKYYQHVGYPHSADTIRKETDFIVYNTWKRLVLENLGDEGVEILTRKIENY